VSISASGTLVCRLADEAAEAPDPEKALAILLELRSELQEFERQQVARALTAGRSFGDVARAMDISRQAAHRRFRDLASRRRSESRQLPPTPEVRLVFEYARREAEAVGTTNPAPHLVVLGVLRCGDHRGAAALDEAGVTLEDARGALRRHARAPGAGDTDIRRVLTGSVECAKRHEADRIEVEHVLRSALAAEFEDVTRSLLEDLGTTPERVLAALDAPPAAPKRFERV